MTAARYFRLTSPCGASEQPPAPAKPGSLAIARTVLRPANGSAEARGAKVVGVENLFDKNAQRTLEGAEYVVHGDDGPVDEVGRGHHEARLSLGEIARRRGNATPPLIDDRRDVVEVALWRQNSS